MHEMDDIERLADNDVIVRERLEFGVLSNHHKIAQFSYSIGVVFLLMMIVGFAIEAILSSYYGLSGAQIIKDLDYFLAEFKGKFNCFRIAQMLNTTVIYGGAAIIMSYLISGKMFGFFEFNSKANKVSLFYLPVILISIIPVVSFIAFQIKQINFPESWFATEVKTLALQQALIGVPSASIFAINFLMIAILPAIFEELFFRGIMQKILIQLIGNRNPGHPNVNISKPKPNTYHAGIIITGLIFGAIHMQISNFVPIALLGILLGYVYWWTKNLWYPIVAHLLFNGVQAISFYVFSTNPKYSEMQEIEVFPLTQTFLSLVVFIGFTFLFYKFNKTTADAEGQLG